MNWTFVLVFVCAGGACATGGATAAGQGASRGQEVPPGTDTAAQKGVTLEKEMQSLDDLKNAGTRAAVAAATRKDTQAGVPFNKLVSVRMTIGGADGGLQHSKGFSFNILVSDHAGFLAALNPSQRADYRRFLAGISVSSDEQIATFNPRVRVLLGHDEKDPSPGLKVLDAQVVHDGRATTSSPFAAFLRPCNSNDGPESNCANAPAGPANRDVGNVAVAARPVSSSVDDWSRIQIGEGPVPTHIRNESDHDLTMRIKDGSGRVVAQIGLGARATGAAHLPHGNLKTLLRMTRNGQVSYFRGPAIDVPAGAARLNLTLEGASIGNLTPMDKAEFDR